MTNATLPTTDGHKAVWPLYAFAINVLVVSAVAMSGYLSPSSSLSKELKQSETIMEDTTSDSASVDPTSKALPVATREELRRPPVAYPTIALLLAAYSLYLGSMFAYVQGHIPWFVSTALSTVAVYLSFTVLHDAVHIAVSPKIKWLNELCGLLAGLPLFAPLPFFRYIHLNHHRYAGDDELDPDAWGGRGPHFLLPLRWMTNLYYYIYYFARTIKLRGEAGISESTRQKDLRLLAVSSLMIPILIVAIAILYRIAPADKAAAPVVCILLPQHLGAMVLIYLFDYVPHRPHVVPYKEDPFLSTNATSFLGSVDGVLWTSVTLSQNLHIIHHLWPFMPFYTYKSLWTKHGQEIQDKGTRVVPLFVTQSMSSVFQELKTRKGKMH